MEVVETALVGSGSSMVRRELTLSPRQFEKRRFGRHLEVGEKDRGGKSRSISKINGLGRELVGVHCNRPG